MDTISITNMYICLISQIVFVGFLIGGVFWGAVCDIIGRKKVLSFFYSSLGIFPPAFCFPIKPVGATHSGYNNPTVWCVECSAGCS